MDVYELTRQLAAALRESTEYKEYTRAKEIAMQNETQKALLEEYKRLQFQLQVSMAGGASPDPAEMERFQKITAVLQLSGEATAYIMAEFRFQRMLSDVYKTLGAAADIDLDMLMGKQ